MKEDDLSYVAVLESTIESLKSSLEKERSWSDFLIKRRESQKNRRWGYTIFTRYNNFPENDVDKVPSDKRYFEDVCMNLEDIRGSMVCRIEEFFDYCESHLPKMDRIAIKNRKVDPHIFFKIRLYLFNQKKDSEVYIKEIGFDVRVKKKYVKTISDGFPIYINNVVGISPGEIRGFDECVVQYLPIDDPYILDWENHIENVNSLLKKYGSVV